MNSRTLLGGAALAAAVLLAGQALAAPSNEAPPAGPVLLDLNGTAIPHVYTLYTASFIASGATTDLSFAFREDPAFLFLDDISLTTGGGPNLVVNGGFESGPVGSNTPTGWTYLNIFGAAAAGVVDNNGPHSGSNNYFDGAVQAYDAITQSISTVAGQSYDLNFWLRDNSNATTFSALSTNGNVTGTGGNGINLVVYAGQGTPTPGGIPEPATWGLMLIGFGGLGAVLRRQRTKASPAVA